MKIMPYVRTFALTCLIGLVSWSVNSIIGYRAVGYLFLLGVLAIGVSESLGAVLFAASLSAVAWNFFFMPPTMTLWIEHAEDIVLCITYFVAALITGTLTHRIRKHEIALREREEQLKQAEILRESEKLHQVLLNSISHEIRTPLTAIVAATTALSNEKSPNTLEFKRALANELAVASDRLNRVTENLLDMSRLSSGVMTLKREWHDVSDLIGVTLQRLGRNLDHHQVKVEIESELQLVDMDFRLLEHALSNIILNAVQYSPPKSLIQITSRAEHDRVFITIEDNGPGISDAHISKVFEKFYRVPGTPAGGTGLGLSIAKGIVELHKGQIKAERKVYSGTIFSIILPRGNAPVIPKEADANSVSH